MNSILPPTTDNQDDDEQFCPGCFAGLESSEHHEQCVAPLDQLNPFHRACCHWSAVHGGAEPEMPGSAYLRDHFSATIELRIAEPQPQYGLVQLNAMRRACGCLVSCDVKRDAFLAAVSEVLNVDIVERLGGDARG